jgi:3-oxoacyl-[acyl-carrier protein] reductase
MRPVAIVTGTRKGLGLYITQKLLNEGWAVAGCSRQASEFSHPCYRHYILDVSDENAVAEMVRTTAKEQGGLNALINNAGLASMNHLLLTPASMAKKLWETNFLGSFLFLRESAKVMRKGKFGRIVNFTTVAAALDLEGEAAYAASKSALESLTRVAARELGSYGITVNAIGPTPIPTDLIRTVPEHKINELVARQAIKRLGTPEDVWNVVNFYLRPESAFITGQIVYLGGIRG